MKREGPRSGRDSVEDVALGSRQGAAVARKGDDHVRLAIRRAVEDGTRAAVEEAPASVGVELLDDVQRTGGGIEGIGSALDSGWSLVGNETRVRREIGRAHV